MLSSNLKKKKSQTWTWFADSEASPKSHTPDTAQRLKACCSLPVQLGGSGEKSILPAVAIRSVTVGLIQMSRGGPSEINTLEKKKAGKTRYQNKNEKQT